MPKANQIARFDGLLGEAGERRVGIRPHLIERKQKQAGRRRAHSGKHSIHPSVLHTFPLIRGIGEEYNFIYLGFSPMSHLASAFRTSTGCTIRSRPLCDANLAH